MKFQKGSKVEVMNKAELPTSWCVVEVVSRNKRNYDLKYDCYPSVEKVSREFIRPCPPIAKDSQTWVAGNTVEVYNNSWWKTAIVCNVLDGDCFSLRPHGFIDELIAHRSNIREPQPWEDGRWLPILKISRDYGDVKNVSYKVAPPYHSKLCLKIPMPNTKMSQEKGGNDLLFFNDLGLPLQESRVVSCKTLKRFSPFCSSRLEAYDDYNCYYPKKLKKIDHAFASKEDQKIQASFVYEEAKERILSEANDTDIEKGSVGSCSINTPYVDIQSPILSSDAKSGRDETEDGNYFFTPQRGIAEGIHILELNAYHSTLEALYAFGPLSWEKEALLTDLRINLHISNDEHLIELRNLISPGWGALH